MNGFQNILYQNKLLIPFYHTSCVNILIQKRWKSLTLCKTYQECEKSEKNPEYKHLKTSHTDFGSLGMICLSPVCEHRISSQKMLFSSSVEDGS